MDNQKIITAGVLGGTVTALFNSIPVLNFVNCLCCLGIMTGGGFAVFFYQRNYGNQEPISPALAVTLGLASGLFGAFLGTFLDWMFFDTYGNWIRSMMSNPDLQMAEGGDWLSELMFDVEMQLDAGFPVFSTLIRNLLILPLFCLFGALITRGILNRNKI